jgi:tetratricopeptide (TPR) repeat protein
MELTLDQALQKGIEAHKAGKAQEADRIYTAILKANPKHPDANHNLGVLAVGVGKLVEALPFFKTALEDNSNIAQYWLSYIDALIKLDRMDDAKAVFDQAKSKGAKGDTFDQLEQRLGSLNSAVLIVQEPPKNQLQGIINLYTQGQYKETLTQALQLLKQFPHSIILYSLIGAANQNLGRLEEAIEAYKKALSIKPDNAETYYNIGIVLQKQGKLEMAIEVFKKALSIKPDYAAAYWNVSGTAANISEAKNYIEHCRRSDPNHLRAQLTLCALKFYEGDKSDYNALVESSLKDHPYTRSFAWAFSLPKLPSLHFHRWALFDHMVDLSTKDRPFYEFGVWRGEAFRYLIKTFKKGYGFDTFEGIPEDWHNEKVGTYTSDGNVPKINGGKFIVGKFEDTLPAFFAESRPMASIINFDADLYSSTICALNFAKPVIDQHTILIFDEFIINKNWEQDEYKALEEFCSNNDYTYEVLAISFFTKQVAVKLIGI